MAQIVALPPELIGRIAYFIHPPQVVDFASTCVFISESCRDILKQHQTAYHDYRLVNDRSPMRFPNLLRKVMHNPITAWHVNTLEIWGTRATWSDWDLYDFDLVGESTKKTLPPPEAFNEREKNQCLDLLRESFRFQEDDVDKARQDLERGNDSPLKFAIFALCPRLKTLKYTRSFNTHSSQDPWADDAESPIRSHLDYLRRAIQRSAGDQASNWATGLAALHEVDVGVESGEDFDHRNPQSPPHLLADIMKLPKLTSVYCYGIAQGSDNMIADDDEDDTIPKYNLRERSSSVQHIFLDSVEDLSWKFRETMISACKHLESLTIKNSEMVDVDALVGMCSKHHHKNLKTLLFYGPEELAGYRCTVYRPEEIFDKFDKLQLVWITADDVMLDAMYNSDGKNATQPGHEWIGDFNSDGKNATQADHAWIGDFDFFTRFLIDKTIPPSLEALVLGRKLYEPLFDGDAEMWDHALAALVESKEYPNLKAIYLGALDDEQKPGRQRSEEPRDKAWFQKTIAAGRTAGIDVHTRTTRGEPRHQIEFPMPARTSELEYLSQSSGHAFDIYTGTWGPRPCSNCGRCETCLAIYTPAVWEKINAINATSEA